MLLHYINWNVSPEIFHYSFISVRWYGLLFALSFFLSYLIMMPACDREGYPQKARDSVLLYMLLSSIIGARLGHCLFYEWDYYSANPLKIFAIWEGGLASHGGVAGVIFALWLCNRNVLNKGYLWYLDRIAMISGVLATCVRLGNLFNSEIYGKPTTVPWAFIFERTDPQLLPRHPTQLYEALYYLLVFLFLYTYYQRNIQKLKPGILFSMEMVFVFSFRFFIEFIKEKQVDFESNMDLNMGQWLSIPFVLCGVILFLRQSKAKPVNCLRKDLQTINISK